LELSDTKISSTKKNPIKQKNTGAERAKEAEDKKIIPGSSREVIGNKAETFSDYSGNDFVVSPPTFKQVKFAERLAHERGETVPENAMNSMSAMSSYIEELLRSSPGSSTTPTSTYPSSSSSSSDSQEYGVLPTEKQISFAESLCAQKGLEIPPSALTSRKLMSAFIGKALKAKALETDRLVYLFFLEQYIQKYAINTYI
jgi:hypothetical protein